MYFNDIEIVRISDLVNNQELFYAHRKENKVETLQEHSDLVVKYFKRIFEEKLLKKIFINFENFYLKDVSSKGKKLFRKLLINVFSFHDIGKINPYFQKNKMDNIVKENEKYSKVRVGSEHSLISAASYLDYFISELDSLESVEKKVLRVFLFINSFIISRHHSPLSDFKEYLRKFQKDDIGFDILELLNADEYYKPIINLSEIKLDKAVERVIKKMKNSSKEEGIYRYVYMKLVYSLLLASDFYATNEFSTESVITNFGDIDNINKIYSKYKETELYRNIMNYSKNEYSKNKKEYKDINELRSELFLDSEQELLNNINKDIFFLEAPTGSGKSNVAFNLSFKLINDSKLKKILYIYPFNTLVEQNKENLGKIFSNNNEIINNIAVVNSITPIKLEDKEEEFDLDKAKEKEWYSYKKTSNIDYSKALLDRQFLNYPIILSTHVSLFDIMFNRSKEDSFAFYQLANSVIILDEIQSYKNIIWGEIITFLQSYAKILNMKIIIMSATLPDLEKFIKDKNIVKLIKNRDKYFGNSYFKNRVKVNYQLLNSKNIEEDLFNTIVNKSRGKKIVVEFIRKKSAYNFYDKLKAQDKLECLVELITGDDNQIERKRILNKINSKDVEEKGIILVATQVIEAGIDIDMDIGFKDISKLDSEEQFMGRINRSCLKDGLIYFFNMDSVKKIYSDDVRVRKELTLDEEDIRINLLNKDFGKYYDKVIEIIKMEFNYAYSDNNLENFFKENVLVLDAIAIEKRMKLIDDDRRKITVFVNRDIELHSGEVLSGSEVWQEYCGILENNNMNYAEKKVKLSIAISKLLLFTYEIMMENEFSYNDKRGDIYYIDEGEQYFINGKFNKNNLLKGDVFI